MSVDSDPHQPELLQHLHRDHVRLAKVLDVIEREVEKWDADDAEVDLDLLRSAIDYIADYPDAVHHPLEDVLFERLAEQRLTSVQRGALERNVREHRELAKATKKVAADIDMLFAGAVVPVERLQTDIGVYLSMQREHMHREQAEIFPLAEREISPKEWAALLEELALTKDPLFARREGRFESLYDYVTSPGEE